jgi:hypothetical protein
LAFANDAFGDSPRYGVLLPPALKKSTRYAPEQPTQLFIFSFVVMGRLMECSSEIVGGHLQRENN